ncbi:sulfatase-like hydrolase/transferase [Brachybacterium fresconis]|uniref:Arylsulfatase A-like enzyme n=1 Tax=Brachybacterium fresconis TaxID=173363 RepID=A0ABS4YJP7_9MICO|nr:sulfatase-like hydrolase/transferase [Brachybacterium fresconis]MBP2409011.1 arylsulfatase A-like enzyme [Brachybacterium fresconis]
MTRHRPPNVVILYADDLGWGDLGCFGAEDVLTPQMDSLGHRA